MTLSGYYCRPLVATDLDDATTIRHLLAWIDPSAAIVLLRTYRIPHDNLRAVFGGPRLERELRRLSSNRGRAWIATSGLDPSRFHLRLSRGGLVEAVEREVPALGADLVILAPDVNVSRWEPPAMAECVVVLRRSVDG